MAKPIIIPIFVPHWGCLYDCVFCNQKKITGVKVEPSARTVTETIEAHLATMSKAASNREVEIAFYGGSFTAIPREKQKELLEVAKGYLHKGLVHKIRISTRPDCLSDEVLDFIEDYGVSVIELGVQSMDSEVLFKAGRGHGPEDVVRAVKLIRSRGNFRLGLQMMLGLPGDTPHKAIETAHKILQLEPDFVRIYPALVIKDTPLATLYFKGEYRPLEIDEAVEITKQVYLVFLKKGIPVIRIGLQPTEEISADGDVIAGPFHPAFRELVESALALDKLVKLIEDLGESLPISLTFEVAPQDISIVRGQRNKNVKYLKENYNLVEIEVLPNSRLLRGEIILRES